MLCFLQKLEDVQSRLADLDDTVSRQADQLTSIRLSDFMDQLHASLVNFTNNVLTLDQWHEASAQVSHRLRRVTSARWVTSPR
jgi:hypothetical protein